MYKIAFYKGVPPRALDRFVSKAIRIWTRSIYSHVELVDTNNSQNIEDWHWYSARASSDIVGGLTTKEILQHQPLKDWDIFDINNKYDRSIGIEYIRTQIGKNYDWTGIFLAQILPLSINIPHRWFCSEIVHRALLSMGVQFKYSASQRYSPKSLYVELMELKVIDWTKIYKGTV